MPSANTIPFTVPGFEVDQVNEYDNLLVVQAHSNTREAICPGCDQSSSRVHSYYTRTPRDLPSSGRTIRLVLGVRRFRCQNPRCKRTTFAERIPHVVLVHGQRTQRLTTALHMIAFELSAEAGARVTQQLNMAVSGDTLLRVLRQTPTSPTPLVHVLGIDDWAFKKGREYGTLLVDLEQQSPIDLLPDRSAETLADWLKAHPEVEIVTRDRAGEYMAGITQGAPQAIQVADRWHLLRNLWEALAISYDAHQSLLHQLSHEPPPVVPPPMLPEPSLPRATASLPRPLSPIEQARAQRRAYWENKFAAVHHLRDQGLSLKAIAGELNLTIHTVRKYSRLPALPKKTAPKPGPRLIDPYRDYLRQRLLDGQSASRPLWRELRERGFPGGHSTVYKAIVQLRQEVGLPAPRRRTAPRVAKQRPLTARALASLVLLQPDELSDFQQDLIAQAGQLHPDIHLATQLAREFAAMLRQRTVAPLDAWIRAVQTSSLASLVTFVSGLLQDDDAVRAAFTLPWSNGQVEGQVNRLKVIKRMMYGRAKFDLLRLRVLHPT